MAEDPKNHETEYVQNMSQHYKQAAEELLHAYQRNKEAARHHEAGAFKAALHHAKLSKHHSFNAHAHLTEALGMAALALAGIVAMTLLKEINGLSGRPISWR